MGGPNFRVVLGCYAGCDFRRRRRGTGLRQLEGIGSKRGLLSVENDNDFKSQSG